MKSSVSFNHDFDVIFYRFFKLIDYETLLNKCFVTIISEHDVIFVWIDGCRYRFITDLFIGHVIK